jgi:hypothetical protein
MNCRGLFCDKGASRTLAYLSVTRHLVAEAGSSAVVDSLIEFTIFACWHDLPSVMC